MVEDCFAAGVIQTVQPGGLQLIAPTDQGEKTVRVRMDAKTRYSLDGKPAALDDLKPGMKARVSFGEQVNGDLAERIDATTAPPAEAKVIFKKLAEVKVMEAERRLARVSELVRQGLVPAAKKEQAERELARAKAALDAMMQRPAAGFGPEADEVVVPSNVAEFEIVAGQAAQPALVITDADNGKTVQARVGQEVRVSLKGERKQTGWEVSQGEGKALRPLKAGGTIGDTPIPALEFTPDKEGVDDIGTYTFRYTAVAKGTSTLRFVYVYPSGSEPTPRTATALVREFSVTVQVGGPAT